MNAVLDVITAVLMLGGSLLTLAGAAGLLRFQDVLSRMHAATKPQVIGIMSIVGAAGLQLRSTTEIWMLILVVVFQLVTTPVAAHLVGGLAYRTGGVNHDDLVADDLKSDVTARAMESDV